MQAEKGQPVEKRRERTDSKDRSIEERRVAGGWSMVKIHCGFVEDVRAA